ncbi:MAG: DUF3575 domain-containing protein [Clostridium sp.]|nr:DUF3575 domain-containing protein [Clostridium sp.]
MKNLMRILAAAFLFLSLAPGTSAQRVALKSNALEWVALSPNLGLEARLSRRLTLDVRLTGNPFRVNISDCHITDLLFQPELRWWFNRPMARHFAALSFIGGIYDVRLRSRHYEGDILGAGLSYGYALVLGRHWNVEFEAGVGFGHLHGFKYRSPHPKPSVANWSRWTAMPIRIGVNFSYVFK